MMARNLRITGLVQGVGYRAAFASHAQTLNLSGWVRNRRDGSVEALVCGDAVAIDKIIAWARRGPPGARVNEVRVDEADDPEQPSQSFAILSTA
jgi:acylphosphatase